MLARTVATRVREAVVAARGQAVGAQGDARPLLGWLE